MLTNTYVRSIVAKTLAKLGFGPPGKHGRARATVTCTQRWRPALEAIETRLAPATVYYDVLGTTDAAGSISGGSGTQAVPYQATTLRAAINDADSNNFTAIIAFDPSLTSSGPATITLSIQGDGTAGPSDFGISGTSNITIEGPSGTSGIILQNSGNQRLFYVAATASLTLENLTLENGNAQGGNGGGAYGDGGGGGAAGLGGAVFVNGGSFTAQGCTFTNNAASGGQGGWLTNGANPGGGGGGLGGPGGEGVGGSGGGAGGGPNGGAGVNSNSHNAAGAGGTGGFGGGGGGAALNSVSNAGRGGFGGGGGGRDYYGGSGGTGGFGGGGGGGGGLDHVGATNGGAPGGFGGGAGGRATHWFGAAGGGGAGLGGGIFSNGGTLTLTDDTFTSNSATGGAAVGSGAPGSGYGGAVFAVNGGVTASFLAFNGNTAAQGGIDFYLLSDKNDSGIQGNGTLSATLPTNVLSQSDAVLTNSTSGGSSPFLVLGDLTPPSAQINQPFSNVTVLHFIDSNSGATAGDFTALVTLGDGNTVTLTSTASSNGQIVADNGGFDVNLSYTYTSDFVGQTFSVQVSSSDGAASATASTSTVSDVPVYFDVLGTTDAAGSISGGSGTQAAPFQATTLRAAINDADSNTSTAIIAFDPSLTSSGSATITLSIQGDATAGPSDFGISGTSNITIEGPTGGNGIILQNSGNQRLFYVAATASLTLENLTLENGDAQGGNGGGTHSDGGGGGAAGLGGAVFVNGGSFTAQGCSFTNNAANGGQGGWLTNGANPGGGGGGLGGPGGDGVGGVGGGGGAGGGPNGGVGAISNSHNAAGAGGTGGFGGGGGAAALNGSSNAGRGGFGGGGGGRGYAGGSGGTGGFGGGGGGGGGIGVVGAIDGGAPGGFGGGPGGRATHSYGAAGGGGAGLGGGIFSNGGTLTLTDDTFTSNSATGGAAVGSGAPGSGYGGAVFAVNGSVTGSSLTFSGNTAAQGGIDFYLLSDKNDSGIQGNGTLSATLPTNVLSQSNAVFTNSTSGGSPFLVLDDVTPPTAEINQPVSNATVLHFTDTNGGATASNFTALVTLGDGNTVTLTSTASSNGQIVADNGGFDVNLSYTYTSTFVGQTFSVQVSSSDGAASATASTSTFSDVPVLYWDPGQTNGTALGGTGTWDTSTADWWNGTADVAWSNTAGADAVFAGTGGTVTLGTGSTAPELIFTTTGYSLTGNTLTLADAGDISVASGATDTVNSTIAGNSGLMVIGGGTLSLTGTNTFTGGTTISGGTLLVDGIAGSVTVDSGGTLGGTGTVGALSVSGGTVDPGDPAGSPGTLSAASADFSNGGTLLVQLASLSPTPSFNQLNVSGVVTLGGTSALTLDLNGTTTPGTANAILSAGSLTGSFSTIASSDNPASLQPSVFPDASNSNQLDLTFLYATSTGVTSSSTNNIATYGDTVTFTATVTDTSSGGGAPTGSLTFFDETTQQPLAGTVNGPTSGSTTTTWTITTSTLSAVRHTIEALYTPTGLFANSSGTVTQTVNPKALTITANAQAYTYGDTLGTLSYNESGLVSGDSLSGALTVTGIGGTGTLLDHANGADVSGSPFTIAQGSLTAGSNYTITYNSANLTLAAKTLTVSGVTASNKPYDGTTSGPLSGTPDLSGAISGDNVLLTGTGVGTLASPNAGSEAVTITGYGITGADAGDYSFAQPTVPNVTISPLAVNLTGSQTYNGTTTAAASNLTVANQVAGDNLTMSGSATLTSANAGPETITSFSGLTLGGTSAGDYTLIGASGSVTVTPLAVILTGSRSEDGTTTAAASILTVANQVAGDSLTLSGSATMTSANPGLETITSFAGLTLGGASANNYTLTGASGSVTVNAVPVYITPSTTSLGSNATTLVITGSGFSTTKTHDLVTLSSGTATVTAATATKLTLAVKNMALGTLNASVKVTGTGGGTSATVPVATVIPVVTLSTTTKLAANATSLTIHGFGFTTGTTVTLSSGTVGTVTVVSVTRLTVAVTNLLAGALTASVTASGVSSGTAVHVATVAPVVTLSRTANLTANGATATTLTINGYGFTTGTTVTLSSGTVGTVTVVPGSSGKQLTVTVTNLLAGALTAKVTSAGESSATTAVQVATVAPMVTPNTTTTLTARGATATTLIINFFGFTRSSTVTLTGGTAGTVTVVSATRLKVAVTNLVAGALTATVKSSAVSGGAAVQVATVVPAITASTASLAANATTLTIHGFGFSTTALNNVVTFTNSQGATFTGTVTATATKLTVSLSGTGTLPAGVLYASVTIDDLYSSGTTAVQVATVV